jgi:hypothetical protein
VSQCETDEPLSTGFGAYIFTCPVAASRPLVRMPLFATTAAPVQWRSPVSVPDVKRCASVIAVHASPRLWSSRFRMYVSSVSSRRCPVVSSTKVRKPRP